MELYQQIFLDYLAEQAAQMPAEAVAKIVEQRSYQALCRIRAVLADDTLDDPTCFSKIEEIVSVFEAMGCATGGRHDFG